MKALITGGCGFIGSNLAHELYRLGWSIDIVDDLSNGNPYFLKGLPTRFIPSVDMVLGSIDESGKTVNVFTLDFIDRGVLGRILSGKYDYIFHLAANPRVEYSVKKPTETTETNLLKTVGLFECAQNGNVKRVIFSSSCSVYGDASVIPTPEDCDTNPNSPYGLQKLTAEKFAKMMALNGSLESVCLRYFNVYGPRQFGGSPYSTAITSWTHAIFTDQILRSDGDGTQTRDMIYVGDVVSANIAAALHKNPLKGTVFNICTGTSVSNLDILEKFRFKFGKLKIENAEWRPGDVMHTRGDGSYAKSTIRYRTKVSLSEGLDKTWAWWRSAKDEDAI